MRLAVDAIVEHDGKILLIERLNIPYGLALPGGLVEEDESCEEAIVRELKEETNLKATYLQQLHTFSDVKRDPRGRAISVVYVVETEGEALAGDDAKSFTWMLIKDLKPEMLAFDHYTIIKHYLIFKMSGLSC